jgi:hypothetical protein
VEGFVGEKSSGEGVFGWKLLEWKGVEGQETQAAMWFGLTDSTAMAS